MGPAGTVDGTIGRFLLPIGGGSVEVAQKFYFLIKNFTTDIINPDESGKNACVTKCSQARRYNKNI